MALTSTTTATALEGQTQAVKTALKAVLDECQGVLDENGDIDVSAFNATVDTAQITADAIDGTLIADDAVDSEHIAAGAVDNEHLADDAVDSDEIAAGAIDLAHMSVNSVDSDQYVDGSIDNAHLADGAVDTEELAADAVDGTKIADDAVDSEHIAAGAVDLAHMSVNSVDSDQYVDGSIDTAHIADDQVTVGKLAAHLKKQVIVVGLGAAVAATLVAAAFRAHVAGTINAIYLLVTTTVAADDTDYWSITATDRGTGEATNVITAARTSQITGGFAITAHTPWTLGTIDPTHGVLAAGDVVSVTFTKAASGANLVGGALVIEFTPSGS